jgi:hypothetical protein
MRADNSPVGVAGLAIFWWRRLRSGRWVRADDEPLRCLEELQVLNETLQTRLDYFLLICDERRYRMTSSSAARSIEALTERQHSHRPEPEVNFKIARSRMRIGCRDVPRLGTFCKPRREND